jgi:hypothetical protein
MPIQQRSQLKGFGQSTNEKYIVLDINDIVTELNEVSVKSVVAGSNVTVDNTDPANPVVSASGGGGINAVIPLGSGNAYSNITIGDSNAILTPVANRIALMPFIPNTTFTTSNLYFNVFSAVANTNSRILIYSHSNTTGLPDNKLFESTDISVETTGVKTLLTTQTFTAGVVYWLGFYSNGASTYYGSIAGTQNIIGFDSTINNWNSIVRNVTYGSAPLSWGTTHIKFGGTFIKIGLTSV